LFSFNCYVVRSPSRYNQWEKLLLPTTWKDSENITRNKTARAYALAVVMYRLNVPIPLELQDSIVTEKETVASKTEGDLSGVVLCLFSLSENDLQ
jgi:hypothetical protein